MSSHCRDCLMLIESALISEPHQSLRAIFHRHDTQLYQCHDCASCFIFTQQDIALLDLSEAELSQFESAS